MKNTFRFYPGDEVPEWLVEIIPNEKNFKKGTLTFEKETKVIRRSGGINRVYFKKGFTFCVLRNALNVNIVGNFQL